MCEQDVIWNLQSRALNDLWVHREDIVDAVIPRVDRVLFERLETVARWRLPFSLKRWGVSQSV